MMAWCNRTWLLLFAASLACGGQSWARNAQEDSILEALARLDDQAALVQSARAEFTVTHLPTTPDEMARIGLLCKQRGHDYRAGTYYISAHQARRRSYHSMWYRKGASEREEKTYIARPAIVETTVFDGTLVKTLDGTPGRSCLYINSPASNWVHKHRIQPFAFAFEFRSMSHGELVRGSPERRVVRYGRVDDARAELALRHPDEDRLTLRLVFDEQFRLVEREAILSPPSPLMQFDGDEPAIYSRHEFSDYKPYDDGHGKRIWFPSKATLRYYLGRLSDGTPVQNYALLVNVRDIEFNGPIADEKFTIKAPEGVPVYDRRQDNYSTIAVSY